MSIRSVRRSEDTSIPFRVKEGFSSTDLIRDGDVVGVHNILKVEGHGIFGQADGLLFQTKGNPAFVFTMGRVEFEEEFQMLIDLDETTWDEIPYFPFVFKDVSRERFPGEPDIGITLSIKRTARGLVIFRSSVTGGPDEFLVRGVFTNEEDANDDTPSIEIPIDVKDTIKRVSVRIGKSEVSFTVSYVSDTGRRTVISGFAFPREDFLTNSYNVASGAILESGNGTGFKYRSIEFIFGNYRNNRVVEPLPNFDEYIEVERGACGDGL